MNEKIKKALRYSLFDGASHSVMVGIGEHYLLAYAILMCATDLQLGLVATLPIFLASILQLFSIKIMHTVRSRKKSVLLFSSLQALIWIPIIFVYSFVGIKIPSLIFFVSLYWVFGLIVSPIWTSWIGDLVPEKIRGKYFSKRQVATSIAVFVSFVLGGFILTYAKDTLGDAYIGFAVIFVLALLARFASVFFLNKQYEPKLKIEKEKEFALKDFIFHFSKRFKKGHFNTAVLYFSFISFGIYFIAPYIVAFMLKDLNFSYMQYAAAIASYLVVQVTLLPIWGKILDKYGSLSILKLTGILMVINPFLWIFPKELAHVVFIQIYAGFAMSGFMLASFNFLLETTTPKKRATAISYFHLINGTFIFLGSISAALLIKVSSGWNLVAFNDLFWSKYVIVFLVSGLWRLGVSLTILPKLKEIKIHKKISSGDLALKVISSIPGKGLQIRAHVHSGK
ncbi:MFS transporter [archaeon]|nr:MFS transporter [archaeon]